MESNLASEQDVEAMPHARVRGLRLALTRSKRSSLDISLLGKRPRFCVMSAVEKSTASMAALTASSHLLSCGCVQDSGSEEELIQKRSMLQAADLTYHPQDLSRLAADLLPKCPIGRLPSRALRKLEQDSTESSQPRFKHHDSFI